LLTGLIVRTAPVIRKNSLWFMDERCRGSIIYRRVRQCGPYYISLRWSGFLKTRSKNAPKKARPSLPRIILSESPVKQTLGLDPSDRFASTDGFGYTICKDLLCNQGQLTRSCAQAQAGTGKQIL